MQPWYETGARLRKFDDDYCTCCGRQIEGAARMLELDQRTNTYHDLGGVPDDKSQGWFPFGLKCAKKLLKQHHDKTTN